MTVSKIIKTSLIALTILLLPHTIDEERLQSCSLNEYNQATTLSHTNFMKVTWKKVPLSGTWKTPPNVVICHGITTIDHVKSALNFWESVGYTFGSVRYETPFNCQHEIPGAIKITIPSNRDDMKNKIAITELSRLIETGDNFAATIKIWAWGVDRKLVLEHEIGHALGWLHSGMVAHIMFPRWTGIGHATDFVTKEDYLMPIGKN